MRCWPGRGPLGAGRWPPGSPTGCGAGGRGRARPPPGLRRPVRAARRASTRAAWLPPASRDGGGPLLAPSATLEHVARPPMAAQLASVLGRSGWRTGWSRPSAGAWAGGRRGPGPALRSTSRARSRWYGTADTVTPPALAGGTPPTWRARAPEVDGATHYLAYLGRPWGRGSARRPQLGHAPLPPGPLRRGAPTDHRRHVRLHVRPRTRPRGRPGTATGTPGDWWRTFALVPDVLEHCVAGFCAYRSPTRTLPADLRELGQIRCGWAR